MQGNNIANKPQNFPLFLIPSLPPLFKLTPLRPDYYSAILSIFCVSIPQVGAQQYYYWQLLQANNDETMQFEAFYLLSRIID